MLERLTKFGRSHEGRLAVIVVIIAAFFAVMSPGFRSLGNFRDLLESHLFSQHPTTRSMGAGRELYGLRKDGTEVPSTLQVGVNLGLAFGGRRN